MALAEVAGEPHVALADAGPVYIPWSYSSLLLLTLGM